MGCPGEKLLKIEAANLRIDQESAAKKTDSAEPRHDEGLDASGHRLGVIAMERDERIGAERRDFPEDHDHEKV